jgi:mono/diheme cytochrome c family protein
MMAIRGFTIRTGRLWGAGALSVALLASGGSSASASDDTPVGSQIFKTYCASCHGVEAKGDGSLAQHLRTLPPDLTKLASRNKGKFDADGVARIVDGRNPAKGHGGPDMPVWGDAFKQSREGFSEDAVKARIAALVEFLESIQAP